MAVAVFHAITLTAPSASDVDAVFSQRAFYGRTLSWDLVRHVVPFFADFYYWLPNVGAFLLRTSFHLLGIGLWQARAVAYAAAIISLALLWKLCRVWKLNAAASFAAILVGSTLFFFLSTHTTRAEPLIFLLMVVNFLWLYTEARPAAGFFVGLSAGFGPAIYLPAIILIAAMPVLLLSRTEWKTKKASTVSWFFGLALGGLIGLHSLNIDALAAYGHLNAGKLVSPPLILKGWKNPWTILYGIFQGPRLPFWQNSNPLYETMLMMTFTSLAWMWKRFNILERGERNLLILATTMSASFGLLSGSRTPFYMLYLLPWFFICVVTVSVNLLKRPQSWRLDSLDLFFVIGAFVSVLFSHWRIQWILLTVPMLVLSVRTWKTSEGKIYRIAFLGLMLSQLLFDPNSFVRVVDLIRFTARVYPRQMALCVGIIGAIVVFDRLTVARPHWRGRAWVGLSLLIGGSYLVTDWRAIAKECAASQIQVIAPQKFLQLKKQRRLIAPPMIWLRDPSIAVQSPFIVEDAVTMYRQLKAAKLIDWFQPTAIYWPKASLRILCAACAHDFQMRTDENDLLEGDQVYIRVFLTRNSAQKRMADKSSAL